MSRGPAQLRELVSEVAVPSGAPVLMLDFDGTVSLGDGPVLAYADEAFSRLPAGRRAVARQILQRFLDGDPDLGRRYADGYGCVRDQTVEYLTPDQLSAAYLASRRRLAADDLGSYPAPGVADLLAAISDRATTVVLTNSPAVGVIESLERFGLADLLDQVVVGAHKPHRMAEHVDVLTAGRPAATLISVGDHWANDLAVPLERGCATAYISADPAADEPAHVWGPDLAVLAPAILDWAADPAGFVDSRRPVAVLP